MRNSSLQEILTAFDEEAIEVSTTNTFAKPQTKQQFYQLKLADKQTSRQIEVRFLPNLDLVNNRPFDKHIVEQGLHWVATGDPILDGYHKCSGKGCPLCVSYWKLYNSKNEADKERASALKKTTKYYAYVLIVRDVENKDLEGTIQILQFSYQVYEKVKQLKEGVLTGSPVNAFNPKTGANFVYTVTKNKGSFASYTSSYFKEPSSIDIKDIYIAQVPKLPKLNDIVTEQTEEEKEKVAAIIATVTGGVVRNGQNIRPSTTSEKKLAADQIEEDDDFFNINENL